VAGSNAHFLLAAGVTMDQKVEVGFGPLSNGIQRVRHSSAGMRALRSNVSTLALAGDVEHGDGPVASRSSVAGGVLGLGRLVSIVDDDVSTREALPALLRSFGFEAAPFASGEAFLASDVVDRTRCLVLDIAMPGMTGPELQNELVRRNYEIPIVFITAHSDDRIIPGLLSRGAVACIYKPLSEAAFLEAVNAAFARGGG
jgi:CheY-like chemotaxis protein